MEQDFNLYMCNIYAICETAIRVSNTTGPNDTMET